MAPMRLSLATLPAINTSAGGGGGEQALQVCETLALLLVRYGDNCKINFINHETDHNRKKIFDLSYNMAILPSPNKAF